MPATFDGYHVWLGIPASEQPPNHYRLLGITLFEVDLDVIDHAADRQMAHVRTFQTGPHRDLSQLILNELAAARMCLLSLDKKTLYDEALRSKMKTVPKASPVLAGQPLPKAQLSGAIPRATPVAPPKAVTAPGSLVSRGAKPALVEDNDLASDMDAVSASGSFQAPGIKLGARRRSRRNDTWQRPAMMGILAALAVMCFFLLYELVKWMNHNDWRQYIDSSILEPAAPATAPNDPRSDADDTPAPLPEAAPADADASKADTPQPDTPSPDEKS